MDAQPGGYAGTSAGSATGPLGGGAAGARGAAAQDVVGQVKDTAQGIAGQVKDQVGQRAESAFDQGKTRAADTLGSVAQTLRQSTQQLQDQQQQRAGQYVERAADQVERFADYLRTADVRDMADRVEDAARRQPALFLGGLFALGLAGARFLKSSRRNDARERMGIDTAYPAHRGLERGPSGYRGGMSTSAVGGTYGDLSGGSAREGLGGVSGGGAAPARGYGEERDVTGMRGAAVGSSAAGEATGGSTGGAGFSSLPLGGR